jgi:hypothetical protein
MIKGKKIFNENEINTMVESYNDKLMSINDIGKIFGCGGKPIHRILKNAGVKLISGSPMNFEYWVQRGMCSEDAKYKVKTIRPTNIEYWLKLGFDMEAAKVKLNSQRMLNESSFILKYGDEIGRIEWAKRNKLNVEVAKRCFKNTTKHWKLKGFTDSNEIKNKISEVQKKFSLEKCVEKYGEVDGTIKWQKRQDNWVNKMKAKSNISEINKTKDSKSINYFKIKFGDLWIEKLIENRGYFDESVEFLKNCVKNSATYDELIIYIGKTYPYIDQYDFQHKICRKLLSEIYHVNYAKFRQDLLNIYLIDNNSIFGNRRESNGLMYSSNGEYFIAEFLNDNHINFTHDKRYPFYPKTRPYRYDFYLPDIEYYIEYAGMLINGMDSNKIIIDYDRKLKLKISLCELNNFNIFASSDYKEIIKFVKELYEKNNKNF